MDRWEVCRRVRILLPQSLDKKRVATPIVRVDESQRFEIRICLQEQLEALESVKSEIIVSVALRERNRPRVECGEGHVIALVEAAHVARRQHELQRTSRALGCSRRGNLAAKSRRLRRRVGLERDRNNRSRRPALRSTRRSSQQATGPTRRANEV